MTGPEDIPEDVWEMAMRLALTERQVEPLARALLAYGQSRADAATERAARAVDDKIASERERCKNYVGGGPAFREAMLRDLATAIRSQK